MKKQVKQECKSCHGTGLYSGLFEGKGQAVICIYCNGQGWDVYSYAEFAGRKKMRGIKSIRKSHGTFIANGVGAIGPSMTYEEFERAYPVEADK